MTTPWCRMMASAPDQCGYLAVTACWCGRTYVSVPATMLIADFP
jgi:hypothetical protein